MGPGAAQALLAIALLLSACASNRNSTPQPGAEVGAPTAFPASLTPSSEPEDIEPPATRAGLTPAPLPTATARSGATAPTDVPTPGPGQYANPVLQRDFPDPDILQVEGAYYAYATNSEGVRVQAARSEDLVEWEYLGEVLPSLPGWAVKDFGWTWAPDISPDPDGEGFLLYYTTRFAIDRGGVQCIGAAAGEVPDGPFRPHGEEPVVCQRSEGGSIDPATFEDDDGARYLLWKNDGNSGGGISWIYIQQLAPDGLSLQGDPERLIKADLPWEGVLVEGPTLWKHEGRYYLFYSANDYASPRYAVGYAVADQAFGPYTKAPRPLLETDLKAGIVGPGGQDIVVDAQGQTWILFHAWSAGGARHMAMVRLDWQDGEPRAGQLSRGPQPAPAR